MCGKCSYLAIVTDVLSEIDNEVKEARFAVRELEQMHREFPLSGWDTAAANAREKLSALVAGSN